MTWHADPDLLLRYAERELDAAAAWSVEAHITGCQHCRAMVTSSTLVEAERVGGIRRSVQTRLDAPDPQPVERLLRAAGVPPHLARLLAATPSLTLSWMLAVGFVLATAVVATHVAWRPRGPDGSSLLWFLTLAPLVPLAGVAAAFGPSVDPTYEIGLAAPLRSGKLLLVRAVAVLSSSLVLAGIAALFLPSVGWTVGAWIVPALAVTAASLAASTVVSPLWATGGVGATWLALVLLVEAAARSDLAAFGTVGQLVGAAVLAVSSAILWGARERFEHEVGT